MASSQQVTERGGRHLEVRCYGGSMDFFFASGDTLLVDTAARADPSLVRPGDIVAYLDWAEAPVVSVHRVIARYGGPEPVFFTKGDGNLWFDPPVRASQLVGRVTAVKRGGSFVALGEGSGLRLAVFSWFAEYRPGNQSAPKCAHCPSEG